MKKSFLSRFVCLALLAMPFALRGAENPEETEAALHAEITRLEQQLDRLQQNLELYRRDILSSLLSDKLEELTDGVEGDAARTMAVARWVCAHTRNLSRFFAPVRDDAFSNFATRVCGGAERANLFIEMCDRFGVFCRRVEGYPGLVEAVYAEKPKSWHLFDFENNGVFVRDSRVLSLDELRAEPELVDSAFVAFPAPFIKNRSREHVSEFYRNLFAENTKKGE